MDGMTRQPTADGGRSCLLLLVPGGLLCLFFNFFPRRPYEGYDGGEHGACPLCARYQVAREHVRVLCCVKGSPTPGPR